MRYWIIVLVVMSLAGVARTAPGEGDAERRAKADQAWRESDEGKRAIAEMTVPTSRLQLRLVLTPEEKGEADEMIEVSGAAGPDKVRVAREVLLNEKAVAAAAVGTSLPPGRRTVTVALTDAGGRQMEWATSRNIGRRLAIVFDGKLIAAPTIRSAIGKALVIDGGRDGFDKAEADRLVAALNAGADEAAPKK